MLLLPSFGFDFIILLATALSIVTAIACFAFPVKNISLTPEHRAELKKWSFSSFVEPKVLFISGLAFLIGLSYSSVLGFLSIYAGNLGLENRRRILLCCLCIIRNLHSTNDRSLVLIVVVQMQ